MSETGLRDLSMKDVLLAVSLILVTTSANAGQSIIAGAIAGPIETTTYESLIVRGEAYGNQRDVFQQAETALEKGRYSQYRQLRVQLKNYPLSPYLDARYLEKRLSQVSLKQIQDFLQAQQSTVAGEKLRRDALRHFARYKRWSSFLAIYTPQHSDTLQCQHKLALLSTGKKQQAFADTKEIWLNGRSMPNTCDKLFKKWQATGHLTPDLIWQRIDLAMENGHTGLVRYLAKSLNQQDRAIIQRWLQLRRKPGTLALSPILQSRHPHKHIIIYHTLTRLSYRDPIEAARLWSQIGQEHFTDPQNRELAKNIGLSLAHKHKPEAYTWLNTLPASQDDEELQAWKIRSAIRTGHWQQVIAAIQELPTEQQARLSWQYWWAYAKDQLGQENEARGMFEYLAGHRDFYGFLAADQLGVPYSFEDEPLDISHAQLLRLWQYPQARRAQELYTLHRIPEARREWSDLLSRLNQKQKLAASRLAQLWNWHDRAILTLGQTSYRDDVDLRFPLTLRQKVESWSKQHAVDPALTYAIIRRESAFMKDARSARGALGLMQLMPTTARHVARSLRTRYRGARSLIRVDTNLSLGTRYLGQMLERLDSQSVLATAAYNAGPNRVETWLPEKTMAAERWIETIPFKETRRYVRNVMAYRIIYDYRLNDSNVRMRQFMPAIVGIGDEDDSFKLSQVSLSNPIMNMLESL